MAPDKLYGVGDDVRQVLQESGRFDRISGATAFRREDKARDWTDSPFFSFEVDGERVMVSLEVVRW